MTEPPDEIHHVSRSQFSVARHYGGCTFMGKRYVYIPLTDVLIREDVVKKRADEARRATKHAQAEAKATQGRLLK